ncbi:MAG: lytic transglycosylase domain-containing protein, partial [Pseudomonadota bacterium]
MRIMSSMLASVFKSALLLAGVSGVAAASQLTQSQAAWYAQAIESGMPRLAPAYIQSEELSQTLIEWKRLQQSDNFPFSDYANFLLAHPGWPGETSRRAAAETILDSGTWAPGLVIRFFERFAPLTSAGRLRYAEALAASGKRNEAAEQARRAWRIGSLRPMDETKLTGAFSYALTPADHDARADILIWRGQTTAATRQLSYVSPSRRALFEARIAYRTKAADAAERGAAVAEQGRGDPGYIADRASWLRESGQGMASRAYLGQPRQLTSLPGDVEKWYEVLLTAARGAAADGQNDLAYRIASQVDDAYPAGTDISDRPYGERDDYTSLTWLAGTVALEKAGRARDAIGMFDRYSHGSKTPQTQSKGIYWAGRAAEAAGETATAQTYFQRAAGFPDLYYGQLAAERMGNSL